MQTRTFFGTEDEGRLADAFAAVAAARRCPRRFRVGAERSGAERGTGSRKGSAGFPDARRTRPTGSEQGK